MPSALLTRHFKTIMKNAMVDDFAFDFDAAEDEGHSFYLETGYDPANLIWEDGNGYRLCTVPDDDAPTVLLYREETVVGLYRCMMAWVHPDHRGQGLGTRMIVEFAEHFGKNAFVNADSDPADGLGFTEGGYRAHEAARQIAIERQAAASPAASVAPGR